MDIKEVKNSWDLQNKENIQHNFDELSGIEHRVMKDMLSADPSNITPKTTGRPAKTERDMRALSDFGIGFTSRVNGVIHKAKIYAGASTQMYIGLAEQEINDVASSELYVKLVDLKQGWNTVEINFPVEINKTYNLFKRYANQSVYTDTELIRGWGSFPFLHQGNPLWFRGGKYLNQRGTYLNYSTFYEIEVVTNLAQIYYIMSQSVVPQTQFYVGDNPGNDSQFWFKPVGG